jgi:hypothetical protein
MNEQEWLACADPARLLASLSSYASPRKLRLFAVACARRMPELFPDPPARAVLDTAERHADGVATGKGVWSVALRAVQGDVRDVSAVTPDWPAWWWTVPFFLGLDKAETFAGRVTGLKSHRANDTHAALRAPPGEEIRADRAKAQEAEEERYQCALLRDLFPYAPPPLGPACRTADVVALAAAAYDRRSLPDGTLDPKRLAVLANALLEANCEIEAILGHLRSPGPHIRGCWALDLVLGKD